MGERWGKFKKIMSYLNSFGIAFFFSDQYKRKGLWTVVLLVVVLVVITVAVVAGVMVSTSRNTGNSGKLMLINNH